MQSKQQDGGRVLGTKTQAMAEDALRNTSPPIEIPDDLCLLHTENEMRPNRISGISGQGSTVNSADFDAQFFDEFIPTALESSDQIKARSDPSAMSREQTQRNSL